MSYTTIKDFVKSKFIAGTTSALALALSLTPAAAMAQGQHPTTKDQCKNGGWQNYVDDNDNPFKNQGQCIKYVNQHQGPGYGGNGNGGNTNTQNNNVNFDIDLIVTGSDNNISVVVAPVFYF